MKDFVSDPILEGSEASFELNITGESSRQSYIGKFKVKCILTPLDIIEADKLYRDLLGDNALYATDTAKQFAFSLAQLKFRVIEFPPFWKNNRINGGHVEMNVVANVLNAAVISEERFKEKKAKEAEDAEKKLTDAIKNNMLKKEDKGEIDISQRDPDEVDIEEGELE